MTATSPTTGWQPLIDACTAAAALLPEQQVQQMAHRAARITDPRKIGTIQDQPPTPNYRTRAQQVIAAWHAVDPPVTGTTVAGMLLASAHATQRARAEQAVDLVWTGPGTDTIHAQPTSEVVVNLINEARNSIIICTFASRRVPLVHNALTQAVARGVTITLILENEKSSNGQYQQAKRDPFAGLSAENLEWPAKERGNAGNWTPALHAKFVLIDETTLFITSANLTGFALDRNIETGALIRGGPLPARLYKHLRDLAYNDTLTPIN